MARPPPPPAAATSGKERLLEELAGLDVADLLALCLRVGAAGGEDRRWLYLSVLRSRHGQRAQFAACLVCFDLARAGSAVAQREFTALAPTVRALAGNRALVDGLLEGDPYLVEAWAACASALAAGDPREAWASLEDDVELVGELDLLSEDELASIDLDLEELEILEDDAATQDERDRAAADAFAASLAAHLGHDVARGFFDRGRGFATSTAAEVDRLERFLREAAALGPRVPVAAGFASLGYLFLAVHLRRKTLFGSSNPRRIAALRAGLAGLPDRPEGLACAAAILEFEGEAVRERFEKVLELILDYGAFCREKRLDPHGAAAVDAYVAADREPPSVLLQGDNRRRR